MTNPTNRRRWLSGGAATAGGAVLGCATPAGADSAPRTPFKVGGTSIPIAGGDGIVFPVRRIYCIGRIATREWALMAKSNQSVIGASVPCGERCGRSPMVSV
ncbi:MAG: hypothetical protein KGM91_05980 [Burkholderiales bacterium]|nr:hypothetical protein [Burkholderiales bacterium]